MPDQGIVGPTGMHTVRLRLVLAAMLVFCLLRGVNLVLVQMPFEGWDEYQHLAVAEYLGQQDEKPQYGDPVPAALFEFLRRHPHPDNGARQLAAVGVRNYEGKYWDAQKQAWQEEPGQGPVVRMYQAQQGPLYYQLVSLIRGAFPDDSVGAWADTARILNVLFGVAAIALWAVILRRFFTGTQEHLLLIVCAMMAANSVYAYNYAHVANDALAILLFASCVLLYLRTAASHGRLLLAGSTALGLLTGLAVVTKAIALILVPFVWLMFAWHGFARREYRYGVAVAAFSLAYLVVAGGYHAESIQQYGLLTGMQEALINKRNGKDLIDLLHALGSIDFDAIKRTFFYGLLHQGGWSFIEPDEVSYRIYKILLIVALAGYVVAGCSARYRKRLWEQLKALFPLLMLLGLTWAAMVYHGLQTVLAWGNMLTRPPYVMAVFPVVCIFLVGLGAFSKRVTLVLGMAYCVVFSTAYYSGTWKLLELYAPGAGLAGKLDYALSHHSPAAQLYPLHGAVVVEMLLLVALLGVLSAYCRSALKTERIAASR